MTTKCDKCGDESNSAPGLMCGRVEGGAPCDGTYREVARVGTLQVLVEGRWGPYERKYLPQPGEAMLLTNDRYEEAPGVRVVEVRQDSHEPMFVDDLDDRTLVLSTRNHLAHLRDRLPALGERDDEQTIMLEHVLDEWDAFEREYGTAEED
jgi:hypothetical protein